MPAGRVRGLSDYTLMRELGAGRTGVTYLAVEKTGARRQRALKTVERGPKVDKYIAREARIHGVLLGPHPNLVSWDTLVLSSSHLVMVMHPYKGGDLFEFVESEHASTLLDEPMAWRLFLGLLRAVKFLHMHGVYHRDIKPENILLTTRPTTPATAAKAEVRLCDLGYAIDEPIDPNGEDVGTTSFVAPEVLDEGVTGYPLAPTDVWSCVVVLYVMLFRAFPFQDPDEDSSIHSKSSRLGSDWHRDVVTRILACRWNRPTTKSPDVSTQALDLFSSTFVRDAGRRPSLDNLIEIAEANQDGLVSNEPSVEPREGQAQTLLEVNQILEQAATQDYKLVNGKTSHPGGIANQNGSNPNLLTALMASMTSGVRPSHSSPQLSQLTPVEPADKKDPTHPSLMHRVFTAGESLEQMFVRAQRFERDNQHEDAVRIYRVAAERGHPYAQFSLGTCYHVGRGLSRDTDAAAKWLSAAASRGVPEAIPKLNEVQTAMAFKSAKSTPTTITSAPTSGTTGMAMPPAVSTASTLPQ